MTTSLNLVHTGPSEKATVILIHAVGLDLTYRDRQIESTKQLSRRSSSRYQIMPRCQMRSVSASLSARTLGNMAQTVCPHLSSTSPVAKT
jgi:hypothetical protein